MFHTMAEKVRADRYSECREGLFRAVTLIGANLPCPECAEHAQRYLGSVDWSLLRSKDDFRRFLCDFHNNVNARKGFASFDPANLAERYATAQVGPAVTRALFYFQGKHAVRNMALVPNTMTRDRTVIAVRAWFSENAALFL